MRHSSMPSVGKRRLIGRHTTKSTYGPRSRGSRAATGREASAASPMPRRSGRCGPKRRQARLELKGKLLVGQPGGRRAERDHDSAAAATGSVLRPAPRREAFESGGPAVHPCVRFRSSAAQRRRLGPGRHADEDVRGLRGVREGEGRHRGLTAMATQVAQPRSGPARPEPAQSREKARRAPVKQPSLQRRIMVRLVMFSKRP